MSKDNIELLQVRTDTIFHDLYNKEDMNALEWAVMQILGCSYDDIHGRVTVGNIRLTRTSKKDKNKYLDLIVEYKNEKIIIELNNNFSGFYTRNILYAANVLMNNYQIKGKKNINNDYYQEIVRVLLVNLNWYKSKKNSDKVPGKRIYEIPHSDFEEKGYILKIINVNLDYFDNLCYDEISEGDKLYKLLTVKSKDELDMLTKSEKMLEHYSNKLIDLSSNKEYTEGIMDEIIEENVAKQTAYLVGKDEGIEQGIEQNKREMVVNLFKNNVPIDVISESSGLTIDEVKEIIDKSNENI